LKLLFAQQSAALIVKLASNTTKGDREITTRASKSRASRHVINPGDCGLLLNIVTKE